MIRKNLTAIIPRRLAIPSGRASDGSVASRCAKHSSKRRNISETYDPQRLPIILCVVIRLDTENFCTDLAENRDIMRIYTIGGVILANRCVVIALDVDFF